MSRPFKLLLSVGKRAIVFYIAIILFSSTFIDYKKIKFDIQLRTLNKIMPRNFMILIHMIKTPPHEAKKILLDPYILFYRMVAKYFPERGDAHGMLGFCYFHANDIEKAKEAYETASHLAPEMFWYHYNLGLIYFQNQQYDQAGRTLQKALAVDPKESLKYIQSSNIIYRSISMSAPDFAARNERRLNAATTQSRQILALMAQEKDPMKLATSDKARLAVQPF